MISVPNRTNRISRGVLAASTSNAIARGQTQFSSLPMCELPSRPMKKSTVRSVHFCRLTDQPNKISNEPTDGQRILWVAKG